ncbi:MAG: MMPL family transporter [Bifidobacteriaceae bacterium]|jgi:RND superfamily putative drug exporter|nr:MMPL family transporter [Bifidobacteriaceae bacterium]
MSSSLYHLALWVTRHAKTTILGYLIFILALSGLTFSVQKSLNNDIKIPATEAQEAYDVLQNNFSQAAGTQIQILATANDVSDGADNSQFQKLVIESAENLAKIPNVSTVITPYNQTYSQMGKFLRASDNKAVIIQGVIEQNRFLVSEKTKTELNEICQKLNQKLTQIGGKAYLGGDLFSISMPEISITEIIGVILALVILFVAFFSIFAAFIPIFSSLTAVGITILLILTSTSFMSIPSITLILSLMLGIAVGIDYALFILARHRDQLLEKQLLKNQSVQKNLSKVQFLENTDINESIAQAVATAGGAVVFAGMTVIIALLGLGVTGIGFLTLMGQAAAFGVAIAVITSITLLPAILAITKLKILNIFSKHGKRSKNKFNKKQNTSITKKTYNLWILVSTKLPILTIVIILSGLLFLSYPAKNLHLAMTDAASLPANNQARIEYDEVAKHFGEGYNSPLVLEGSIIHSKDPLNLIKEISDEIKQMPGVASIALATPNPSATYGIINIIPKTRADSPDTNQLVKNLRDKKSYFANKYGFNYSVTGIAAIGIDVSNQLTNSILPFTILVIGLAFLILMAVFRSIWIPLTAAGGFLLSIGSTLGIISLIYINGFGANFFNISHLGSVICFMPIILLAILFGLAMDYEVFLISHIREHWAITGKINQSIRIGFLSSAKVITTAGLIMFFVFAMFVPNGDSNIKPIALSLAIGIAIDAFIVRMTLMPAILKLLGNKAWWIPSWLDSILPYFDIEGNNVRQELSLQNWSDKNNIIQAENLVLRNKAGRIVFRNLDFSCKYGEIRKLFFSSAVITKAALLIFAGRLHFADGQLKTLGYVLPARAKKVVRKVGFIDIAKGNYLSEMEFLSLEGSKMLIFYGIDKISDKADLENFYKSLNKIKENFPYMTILLGYSTVISFKNPKNNNQKIELSDIIEPEESK